MKHLKLSLFALTFLSATLLAAAASAGTFDTINSGFSDTGTAAGYPTSDGKPAQEFSQAFIYYINGIMGLTGALFMVLIIFAGYLWLTAYGKEDQVKRAKELIIQALIGISVIIAARLIVELVISQLGKTLPNVG